MSDFEYDIEQMRRISELSDENEQLRKERDFYFKQVSDNGERAHRAIDALNAENEKLREELTKWERLTAGINLPDYPVSQFVPKDIERENAKLRELCGELYHELYAAIDEYWPASYLGELDPRDVFPRYDELIELGVEM